MTASLRSIRYNTDEERKEAKLATTRRYREKQRQCLSSITSQAPTLERLESELTLMMNKYRHQEDHLTSFEARILELETQVSELQSNTVTTSQLEGFRDVVIAEFKRLSLPKRLPISITHKSGT
jgi:predicted  nucleic acid-binding Zn-ribbon protein